MQCRTSFFLCPPHLTTFSNINPRIALLNLNAFYTSAEQQRQQHPNAEHHLQRELEKNRRIVCETASSVSLRLSENVPLTRIETPATELTNGLR
ncbi:hypothetical protein V9T40_003051 [Parthenolecanium corni]|uniref:Uncharacterized protein n=1 Tax=Parthenolecanium corni TaxID=536013 RepID=A0AAN9TQJ9_9HEMI